MGEEHSCFVKRMGHHVAVPFTLDGRERLRKEEGIGRSGGGGGEIGVRESGERKRVKKRQVN